MDGIIVISLFISVVYQCIEYEGPSQIGNFVRLEREEECLGHFLIINCVDRVKHLFEELLELTRHSLQALVLFAQVIIIGQSISE